MVDYFWYILAIFGKIMGKNLRKLIIVGAVLLAQSIFGQVNLEHFSLEGKRAIFKHDYTKAIENLNVVIKRKDKPFEEYFLRGIAKYNLGDHRGALHDFSQTIEIHPFYSQALHYRAVTYSALMEKNKAIQDLNRALEMDPYNARVLMSRGAIFLQMGKLDKALEDLNEAIMIDPEMALAYLNRAIVYKEKEKYVEALDDCNKVISINRLNKKAYAQRGLIKYEMGWFEKALDDFNQALRINSSEPRYYYYRALTKYQLNDIEGTLDDYSKVIQLDPTNALTYYNRAIIYSQVKDYNKAISDLNRVAQLNPNNVLTYFNRGHLYSEKGDYDKSIADYTKAIELFPQFAMAYLMRASAKAQQGNHRGARIDRRKGNHIMTAHDRNSSGKAQVSDWIDSTYFKKIIEFEAEFHSGEAVAGQINKKDMRIRPERMFHFRMLKANSSEQRGRMSKFVTDFNLKEAYNQKILLTNEAEGELPRDSLSRRVKALEERIDTTAPSPDSYLIKGILHQMLQNYSSAMSAYTMAVVNEPEYYAAYLNRAVAIACMKENIKSSRGELRNVSLGPRSSLANRNTDEVDYTPVIEDLNEAIRINANVPEIWYNRGNAKLQMKDYTGAVQDYTQAIERDDDFGEAYYNRGLTLIYLQDRNRGCTDMSKAGELGVKDAYNVIKRYCNDN